MRKRILYSLVLLMISGLFSLGLLSEKTFAESGIPLPQGGANFDYEISYQAQISDENLSTDINTTGTPTLTLTAEQLSTMSSNPDSTNWGKNWVLIVILTIVVIVVSYLLFKKPSNESSKKKPLSPFITCLIVTFIAIFGAIISFVSHNPVWVLIFLLPAVIYETIRTQEGASTKVSSIILLIVVLLEIGMIIFNVNFNLATFFGEQEKYIAGYYLPLGDIKVFGPILVTILSLILLVRTYGPYTKWLSIVLAIGGLLAVQIINPFFFQNILKIIVDAVINQLGSYF